MIIFYFTNLNLKLYLNWAIKVRQKSHPDCPFPYPWIWFSFRLWTTALVALFFALLHHLTKRHTFTMSLLLLVVMLKNRCPVGMLYIRTTFPIPSNIYPFLFTTPLPAVLRIFLPSLLSTDCTQFCTRYCCDGYLNISKWSPAMFGAFILYSII